MCLGASEDGLQIAVVLRKHLVAVLNRFLECNCVSGHKHNESGLVRNKLHYRSQLPSVSVRAHLIVSECNVAESCIGV
jgi:hypothetical protein